MIARCAGDCLIGAPRLELSRGGTASFMPDATQGYSSQLFSVVLQVWQFSDITQLRHLINTPGESFSPVALQLDSKLGKVESVRIYAACHIQDSIFRRSRRQS
jgi:hypothetical protein